ncbi:hypothetical protein N9N28_02130 [Rubripirellula amarantea]|nr:hypothetical protein [Rubripirellula amarantea]
MQAGVSISASDYQIQQQQIAGELTERDLGDRVFPHFIAAHLPQGARGLLIAAIFAAAMSTVSTSLNSSATLVLSDFYQRLWRPHSCERHQMHALRIATVAWGLMGTLMALSLVQLTETVLDVWWLLSGVLGAGIVGLFLLGLLVPTLSSKRALIVLSVGMLIIAWMVISTTDHWPSSCSSLASPFHPYLVIVIGPLAMIVLGRLVAASNERAIYTE